MFEAERAANGDEVDDTLTSADVEGHPVLGPVIADLGYKRVHLLSSGKLGTIPIWEKQRTYRNSRSKLMAAEKQKSMELGFPGIICLYEDNNGRLIPEIAADQVNATLANWFGYEGELEKLFPSLKTFPQNTLDFL